MGRPLANLGPRLLGERVDSKEILVGPSGCLVGAGDQTLVCEAIGAGVALCVFDPVAHLAGLAHVLLPGMPKDDGAAARHAGTVVDFLVGELTAKGATTENLAAAIVGGARGFGVPSSLDLGQIVGQQLRAKLAEARVPVLLDELGGHLTRGVFLHAENGRVEVRSFAQNDYLACELLAA